MKQLTDNLEEVESNSQTNYTFTISPNLYDRISKTIHIIKAFENGGQTRQKWIMEAIQKKLENENFEEEVPKQRLLNVKIDPLTLQKLSKSVEFLRRFRTSFSKKQWILEAIYEKLEEDEKNARKYLKNEKVKN